MKCSKGATVLAVVLLGCVAVANSRTVKDDIACAANGYPPAANTAVDKFVINLDLPPSQRWAELVSAKKEQILNLRTHLVDLFANILDGKIITAIDTMMPLLMDSFPSPFKEEFQALADLSGMELGEVILYNLFYEFFTVCTSIVAEDGNGEIYHARNLDFGLFMGWDLKEHTWAMTEVLRTVVVQLDFQRGGKTVFQSVNFAGYIGVLTGMKPNAFTLTIDDRFMLNGGFIGIYDWITGDRSQNWVGFLTRQLFENGTTFDAARQTLVSAKLLAPVYFILGGVNKGEGMVITKTRDQASADEYWMANTTAKWYVLQTNYDHWDSPPFFDDRRTPGKFCMDKAAQQNGAGFGGLFNVLSTMPVLNKLTTYSALMHAKSGEMETYLQKCETEDCTPW